MFDSQGQSEDSITIVNEKKETIGRSSTVDLRYGMVQYRTFYAYDHAL